MSVAPDTTLGMTNPAAPFESPLLAGIEEQSAYYEGLRYDTGVAGLDELVGGVGAGEVIMVTGHRSLRRPLLARIAGWVAGYRVGVVYVSRLEREHVALTRIVSMAARVPRRTVVDRETWLHDTRHEQVDRACQELHLEVLGSDASLQRDLSRTVQSLSALDLLVVDDASIDPRLLCRGLGVEHVFEGSQGLPGALAHFASIRASAVLVGEPLPPGSDATLWNAHATHQLDVRPVESAQQRPRRADARLCITHSSVGDYDLEITMEETAGLLVSEAAQGELPKVSRVPRHNVFDA